MLLFLQPPASQSPAYCLKGIYNNFWLRNGLFLANMGGMNAKLKVVGGKANKGTISLKLPTVIGRSRKAGLTIAHPMISRRHCELYEADDGLLMIRDFDSLNGTVIAERRIKEAALPPDAEFSIGPLTLRAEYAYEGDLSGLPETVFAEPLAESAEPQESWSDSPEPIAVDQMTETVPPAEEAEVDFSFLDEFKSDQSATGEDEKTEESSEQAPEEAEPPRESVEEQPAVVSPPAVPSVPASPKKKPKGLASMLKGSSKDKNQKAAKQPPLPAAKKPAEPEDIPLAPNPESAPAPPKEPPTKPDEEDFDIDSFLDGLN